MAGKEKEKKKKEKKILGEGSWGVRGVLRGKELRRIIERNARNIVRVYVCVCVCARAPSPSHTRYECFVISVASRVTCLSTIVVTAFDA